MSMLSTLMPFMLLFAGCIALALSMGRHRRQLLPTRSLSSLQQSGLRLAGWLLLLLSLLLCVAMQGIGVGLSYWFGVLSAVAISASLMLVYAPRAVLWLASICCVVGLLGIVY